MRLKRFFKSWIFIVILLVMFVALGYKYVPFTPCFSILKPCITGGVVLNTCGNQVCELNEDCYTCPQDCGECGSKEVVLLQFNCFEIEEKDRCYTECGWIAKNLANQPNFYTLEIAIRDVKTQKIIARKIFKLDKALNPNGERFARMEIDHSCYFGEDGFEYGRNLFLPLFHKF